MHPLSHEESNMLSTRFYVNKGMRVKSVVRKERVDQMLVIADL